MRPDIEDFEELNIPADDAPRSRAMSWLVLAVAVGGFGALAYYAYHSGTQSVENGNVLVVQAEGTPIKEQPADPEGEQFANQDKTIYDVIAPNAAENKVEKLLPEPEKPVSAPQEAAANSTPAPSNEPTTYVNKNLTASSATAEATKQTAASKPAPLVTPVPSANVVAPTPAKKPEAKPVQVSPHVSTTADAEDDTAGEPNFVNEVTVAENKQAASETKATSKPTTKKEAPKPAASGAYQIQLGAFKSEDEARASWKKLSGKYNSVLSGSPTIVKADLPNGTFYRLRAGGYASSAAAKAACAKLGGQACFPVGK